MALLGGMKIRTISLGGSLLLAATAIGGSAYSIYASARIKGQVATVAGNSLPSLTVIGELSQHAMDARLTIAQHILADDEATSVEMDQKFVQVRATVEKDLEQASKLVDGDDDQKAFKGVTSAWRTWLTKAEEVQGLSQRQQDPEAIAMFNRDLGPFGDELARALDAMRDANIAGADEAARSTASDVEVMQTLSILLAAISAIVVMLVVLVTSLRVSRPLAALTAAMEEMAAGNLDRDVPYREQNDEIGGIGRALGAITASIAERTRAEAQERLDVQQRMVSGLAEGLTALRDGKLNHKIENALPPEYETLRHDFNATIAELARLISEVVNGSANVRTGAGEIASAAADLSRRTENQAAALEESAAAVRRITESLVATAATARDASMVAGNAREDADISGETMGKAVDAMRGIAASSSRMGELSR